MPGEGGKGRQAWRAASCGLLDFHLGRLVAAPAEEAGRLPRTPAELDNRSCHLNVQDPFLNYKTSFMNSLHSDMYFP